MKLGNVLEKIFKYTGIKWLVEKIVIDLLGYKSCGCDKRKEKLNKEIVENWTNSIPLKRSGTTDDVANATLFLASDLSSYITGQTLQVCGGMLTQNLIKDASI